MGQNPIPHPKSAREVWLASTILGALLILASIIESGLEANNFNLWSESLSLTLETLGLLLMFFASISFRNPAYQKLLWQLGERDFHVLVRHRGSWLTGDENETEPTIEKEYPLDWALHDGNVNSKTHILGICHRTDSRKLSRTP